MSTCMLFFFFFFNDTATTEIYTLSLHDALPILEPETFGRYISLDFGIVGTLTEYDKEYLAQNFTAFFRRSEEHTSELQSRQYLVCRLLLEKKKYDVRVSLV